MRFCPQYGMFNAMQKPLLPQPSTRVFALLLVSITIAALLVRALPLYDVVFQDELVRFQGIDAYYHARLTTYVVEHFPHRLDNDPLRKFPSGQNVDVYPAYDLLNATAAIIVGIGKPSQRTIESVMAWMPPVLGAVTALVMGLAGSFFGGRWSGIAAALVAGFIPGGTFSQTLLGFADHHALESLLLAMSWFCLIVLHQPSVTVRRSYATWFLLGLLSATYALTWEGGPVLPFSIGVIIGLSALLRRNEQDLGRMTSGAVIYACTGLLVLMISSFISHMIWISAILIALLPFLVGSRLLLVRIFSAERGAPAAAVWFFVIAAAAIGAYAVLPDAVREAFVTNLSRLRPSKAAQTVNELRPMIEDPSLVYNSFGPATVWLPLQLYLLVRAFRESRSISAVIPLILSIIFLSAALTQVRFSASSSLALALLSATLIQWITQRQSPLFRQQRWTGVPVRWILAGLWLLSVPVWSFVHIRGLAATDRGPDPDWIETTHWIREHVPEPGSAPINTYGILNWWDSGYYLVSLAGRPPFSNPTQSGAAAAARLYLDTSATNVRVALQANSLRYVLTDALITVVPVSPTAISGKFPALAVWASLVPGDFFRLVHLPGEGGRLEPRFAFFPSYFKTLHSRLYLYGGKRAEPRAGKVWAIRTMLRHQPGLGTIEIVESAMSFATYASARALIDAQPQQGWMVVSFSPFDTCVPLEELPWLHEVYASPSTAIQSPSLQEPLPIIRMFKLTDDTSSPEDK